jgi:hypothetical protein
LYLASKVQQGHFRKLSLRSGWMKSYWITALVAGLLTAGAVAQTGVSGSASGNTSASVGQNGANANASQNAQVSGSSTNAQVNAQGQTSQKANKKRETSDSSASAGGSSTASGAGTALSSGTAIQAELTKSLDAKKAKAGDEVTAKVAQDVKSDGQVVLRKGSKLIGHVTEAKARSQENSESRLGIAFDRAVLKDGQQVAFNAVIQALAPAANLSASGMADETGGLAAAPMPMPAPSGGMPGGGMGGAVGAVGSTVGTATSTAGKTAGSVGGAVNGTVNGAAVGTLSTASRGVVGLQGLNLNSAASNSTQGSVISSPSHNVKLDSGTQMVLQVNGTGQ